MEACSYISACCCESTRSLFGWFARRWCRTWPGVGFGLGSEVLFLCVQLILRCGLAIALSLVASLRFLSLLSAPLPMLLMRLLNRPNGGVVLGKHEREDHCLSRFLYSSPNNHCWQNSETDSGLHRPLSGLPQEFSLSFFFIIEKASHFHTESGDSFRESWVFWLIMDSSRCVFPALLMGICMGYGVKSLNKVKIPYVYCFFSYAV